MAPAEVAAAKAKQVERSPPSTSPVINEPQWVMHAKGLAINGFPNPDPTDEPLEAMRSAFCSEVAQPIRDRRRAAA